VAKEKAKRTKRAAEKAEENVASGGNRQGTAHATAGAPPPGSVPVALTNEDIGLSDAVAETMTVEELSAYARTLGLELVDMEGAEDEPDEDPDAAPDEQVLDGEREELDRFFAMIEGLPPDSRGVARVTIDRLKPIYFQNVETAGYCATKSLPFSIEEIAEEFGGGTYRLSLRMSPTERPTQNAPAHRTANVRIVHPPHPKIGVLSRDQTQQGVELAPKIQEKMDSLIKEVEELRKAKEPKEAKAKPTPLEEMMTKFMAAQLDALINPPEAVPPPAPPAPVSFVDQLREARKVYKEAKDFAKEFGDEGGGVDPDDDSMLGGMARSAENLKSTVTTIGEVLEGLHDRRAERLRAGKPAPPRGRILKESEDPRQPPQPTPAEQEVVMTSEERDQVLDVIHEAVEVLWERLLDSNDQAHTIAGRLTELLKEKIPERFHAMVAAQLTDENVFKWLKDSANNPENELTDEERQRRLARLKSRRGKEKIVKVLRFLRGEEEKK
jgi:hypothetical protein